MAVLAEFQFRTGCGRCPAQGRHQHLLLVGRLLRDGLRRLLSSQQRQQIRYGPHPKFDAGRRRRYRHCRRHDDPALGLNGGRMSGRSRVRPRLSIPNRIDTHLFHHHYYYFNNNSNSLSMNK